MNMHIFTSFILFLIVVGPDEEKRNNYWLVVYFTFSKKSKVLVKSYIDIQLEIVMQFENFTCTVIILKLIQKTV